MRPDRLKDALTQQMNRRYDRQELLQAREQYTSYLEEFYDTYDSLATIATHYADPEKPGKSLAIPVGEAPVIAGKDKVINRKLYGIVESVYDYDTWQENDDVFSMPLPEAIFINFFVKAEKGDVDAGIFTSAPKFGFTRDPETSQSWSVLRGQIIHSASEHYQGDKITFNYETVPIPSVPDMYCSFEEAERVSTALNSQLPAMKSSLELLWTGIRESDPEAAKMLADNV